MRCRNPPPQPWRLLSPDALSLWGVMRQVLARILFITYMVVLFFIVLNMFIAVLSEVPKAPHLTPTLEPPGVCSQVAHVYSLQPSLDEYREWFKMQMLLKEMFCCCLGYGQDGNSVIDDDDDDEADLEVDHAPESQALTPSVGHR